MSINMSA